MTNIEFYKRELLQEIQRCVELFASKVLEDRSLFTQSAFIEILIRLNFILQELHKKKKRIIWSDDVRQNEKINDITDLLNHLRNAACHSDSIRNYITNTQVKFVFNTFKGKCPQAIQLGENLFLGNEYEDDIVFYYGDKGLYLKRHIKRLIEELPSTINSL
ncbi:MAG: hypothetical protein Q8O95_00795 [bacterium]|nr:hypothetical protein [bacterium]